MHSLPSTTFEEFAIQKVGTFLSTSYSEKHATWTYTVLQSPILYLHCI